ncbi:glycosyltransferase [Roseomonas hellenica]|uniref:Glycosyltransferase n=1 Tax=Plastoroseomonas hellenica TaxID=2687306 RepID=A0ABS5F3T3_9PROT|nr:glycosyltransferase [Plastoroseomonas hellenica]MBR0667183.1 glycosyltransferase [Plastoroseomonas hellenica]
MTSNTDAGDLFMRAVAAASVADADQVSDVPSWHGHIPFAYTMVDFLRPSLFVELGVHKGDSYLSFVRAMERFEVRGCAFGIDSWEGDPHAGTYDGEGVLAELRARHHRHEPASVLIRRRFDEAVEEFAPGSIDLLHIDGLHTYEAVRADFECWAGRLSERAVVLFHDTMVTRADFGVHRFWAEISAGRPSYNFSHGHGLGVLCVGAQAPPAFRKLLDLLGAEGPEAKLFEALGEGFAARIAARHSAAALEVTTARHMAELLGERRRTAELVQRFEAASQRELERERERALAERRMAEGEAELQRRGREIQRLEALLANDRGRSSTEIDRLNALVAMDRGVAKSEIDRLNAEILSDRERAMAEIQRLNAELTEVRTVGQQVLDAMQARIDALGGDQSLGRSPFAVSAVGLRGRLRRARRNLTAAAQNRAAVLAPQLRSGLSTTTRRSRNFVLRMGKLGFHALPLPPQHRATLKFWIGRRVLPWLGVAPAPAGRHASGTPTNQPRIRSDRYLALSRAASGAPDIMPGRSVSIIIPVHNHIEHTLRCLDAVHRHSAELEYEIIVVDDGSTDATAETLTAREDIVYIRNAANIGFVGACNAGAAAARHTYLCFLNNDTIVQPAWLSALVNTFEMHPNVGLAGSKLMFSCDRLQEAGAIVWDDFSAWNWGRDGDPGAPKFCYARHADYCSGASLMVPRALMTVLRGFDAMFAPAYGEDADLAFKVRALGLAVIYQPLSEVIHLEGVSSGTDITRGAKQHQPINLTKLARRWAPVLSGQGRNGEEPERAADRARLGQILVIDQITPEPDKDAGSLATLEMMRELRNAGYKITFVPCSNFTYMPDYTDLLSGLGIESVLYPWFKSVDELLEQRGNIYDAVVILRERTASAYLDLVRKRAPGAKIIFHVADLHFLREEREAALRGNAAAGVPSATTRAREIGIVNATDLTIVHSHHEKEVLAALAPGAKVVTFPWVYDARGPGKRFEDRTDLAFLGGYGHHPNVDAVEYFTADILPDMLQRMPDLVFHAVGSNPPPRFNRIASRNVRVVGFVENISPVLHSARVMVVPLRYGAGVKGKILTAMAHGLPVVTTSIGAEGIGLVDGKEVLIADDPAGFARAVERLYSDPDLWDRLRWAGLYFVARTASRRVGAGIVRDVLQQLGLSVLRHDPMAGDDDAALGTPGILRDVRFLLEAAERPLPGGSGLLVVPRELAEAAVEGWTVAELASAPNTAGRVVAILDATDAAGLATLTQRLPTIAADGTATIVFAPPRLVVVRGRYEMRAAFSESLVTEVALPLHETYRDVLQAMGGTLSWRGDTMATGFANLMLADWRS